MEPLIGALSAVFWGLVVLSVLIVVHESGHFLVARLCSVRVTEFFLGMPCPVKLSRKSKRHGTEFGITPVLLGGYNRICGMESTDDELLADALDYIYRTGSVTAADLIRRFSIDDERAYALLLTLVDWAAIRRYDGEDAEHPVFKTIPRDAAFLCEYDAGHDADEIGARSDGDVYEPALAPDALLAQERSHVYQGIGFLKRLAMLIMGPLVNIVFAMLIVVFSLSVVGIDVGSTEPVVGTVNEQSLAEAAGIMPGDTIVRIGEHEIADWNDISEALGELLPVGDDFDVVVSREGAEHVLHVALTGGAHELLGITNTVTRMRLSLGESVASALSYAAQVAGFALRLINPAHTMEVVGQSSSIVGISVLASEAARTGAFELLLVVAAISMSLGFMNLLPIPPLDGGKILFEAIQRIIGRPVSVRVQNIVSYVGLALLLALFVFVLRNDIIRFLM